MRFSSEGATRKVNLVLMDSAGSLLAEREVGGESNGELQGVRLATFPGLRAGNYRLEVLPDMASIEVQADAGQSRSATIDLSAGRTLQLFPVTATSGVSVEGASAVLLLPDGAGRWPVKPRAEDGYFEVTTGLSEVRVYLEVSGYERWVQSVQLDSELNVVEAELVQAESTWLLLRVLRNESPLVLSAEDLIQNLHVQALDGTPVRFISIAGSGPVPGAHRQPRFEFKYVGSVVVSLEAFSGHSAAEGTAILDPQETAHLDLSVVQSE